MSDLNLNRRGFLGMTALAAGASLLKLEAPAEAAPKSEPKAQPNATRETAPALTVLHLTDTHIRPEFDVPARCHKILQGIFQEHKDIDLIVNTGDSVYAADYKDITRERVEVQWKLWDETVMPFLKGRPMVHALGNHDSWWAGEANDPMYGLPYACQRLGIEKPYYTARHRNWNVLVLNNSNSSIDATQFEWIEKTLASLPAGAPVLVASHFPIYSLAGTYGGSNMNKDEGRKLVELLAAHPSPIVALSGHVHIQSSERLWNINFHCNGALCGAWWEPGEAGNGSYKRTPMGYAIVRLWADGHSESQYYPVPYK
jgi:3',5'-cyclic-AMP phosphodiesterase